MIQLLVRFVRDGYFFLFEFESFEVDNSLKRENFPLLLIDFIYAGAIIIRCKMADVSSSNAFRYDEESQVSALLLFHGARLTLFFRWKMIRGVREMNMNERIDFRWNKYRFSMWRNKINVSPCIRQLQFKLSWETEFNFNFSSLHSYVFIEQLCVLHCTGDF